MSRILHASLIVTLVAHAAVAAPRLATRPRVGAPPVAQLEVLRIEPKRVDVSASASTDDTGASLLFHFHLEDPATGVALTPQWTSRTPGYSLHSRTTLPRDVRAVVVVEDGHGARDSASVDIVVDAHPGDGTEANGFGQDSCPVVCPTSALAIFLCSTQCDGSVVCTIDPSIQTCSPPTAQNGFSTAELLSAAAQCDASITDTTPLAIEAQGGQGGAQPLGSGPLSPTPQAGGAGGYAVVGTSVAELDASFGSVHFVWGIGSQGAQLGGGASTLLRARELADDDGTAGVILVAGAGGSAGGFFEGVSVGSNGGVGGIAISTTAGPCPPACGAGSTPHGGGEQATRATGGAGGGGRDGVGGQAGAGIAPFPGNAGGSGVGGLGGSGGAIAGWIHGEPTVGAGVGQGGAATRNSGARGNGGGGGYGGGGGGNGAPDSGVVGPGGGGGSYAMASTWLPYPTGNPDCCNAADGWLQFTFHPAP